MSTFNFGAPSSSGTSSSSLFGTSGANNSGSNTGGNLFSTNTASNGGALFGNSASSNNTSKNPSSNLFSNNTGGNNGGGNMFASNLSGGNNPFGSASSSNPNDDKTEPPKLTFGAFGTSMQPPATPSTTTTQSPFGSTTPAPATSGGFTFSNTSTTPAGAPPPPSTFNASTGGSGSIFGNAGSASGAQQAAKPAFNFGQPTPSSSTPSGNNQSGLGPNLFNLGSQPSAGQSGPKSTDPQPKAAGSSVLFGQPQAATNDQSAATPGGFFGQATNQTKPTSGLFNLGGAQASTGSQPTNGGSGLFSQLPKPAEKGTGSSSNSTLSSAPPKQSFSFGPPQPAATAAGAAPPLFGAANSTASAAAPSMFKSAQTTSQPAAPSLFPPTAAANTSGAAQPSKPLFSFPTATTTQSDKSSTAPANSSEPASKPLFSFTTSNPATTSAPASSGASTATTSAPSSNAFSLGGASTTAAPPSTQTAATFSASSNTTAPTATSKGVPDLRASTSGPTPPTQSRLRNKTMDEILTRWATDLTRYGKDFKTHAETIAQWDQVIVDNSTKIDRLYVKTRTCERQTMGVEMQLSSIETAQNELEEWLTKYEKEVDEILAKEGNTQSEIGGPDQERERTYKLAERLGERLDDMGRDLDSMVEEVNTANASLSKNAKADEPITQIVRILNSHLTQLQAIDQGTVALQAKVTNAQKSANGLGYLTGAANGEGRAAVDDFYRSYLGRR